MSDWLTAVPPPLLADAWAKCVSAASPHSALSWSPVAHHSHVLLSCTKTFLSDSRLDVSGRH